MYNKTIIQFRFHDQNLISVLSAEAEGFDG